MTRKPFWAEKINWSIAAAAAVVAAVVVVVVVVVVVDVMVVAIIVTAVVVLVVGIVVVVVVEVVAVVDVAVIFCLRLFGTNNYQKVKFLSRNRNREPSLEPAREVVIVRLKVDSDGKSYSESFIATETHEPVCLFCATRKCFFLQTNANFFREQ